MTMGVKRLRQCVHRLSESMSEVRQEHQVDALLAALAKAVKSSGSRKPVLSVGRDGITLRQHRNSFFEVATAATISVYDRSGKRLTTMYLAWPPELAAMIRMTSMAILKKLQGRSPETLPVCPLTRNRKGLLL